MTHRETLQESSTSSNGKGLYNGPCALCQLKQTIFDTPAGYVPSPPPPPGGGTPIWNRRECESEILNLTPKGDHRSRRGSSFLWSLKETNLGMA